MKIEELHEILKNKYKKAVSNIEKDPSHLGFGPSYKDFFVTIKDLTINILQVKMKNYFEIYMHNDVEDGGCTISNKMDGSKVIDLIDSIV